MEELVEQGLAKSIGISNYNGALMLDLIRYAKITPQVLQIEACSKVSGKSMPLLIHF